MVLIGNFVHTYSTCPFVEYIDAEVAKYISITPLDTLTYQSRVIMNVPHLANYYSTIINCSVICIQSWSKNIKHSHSNLSSLLVVVLGAQFDTIK